MIRLRQYAPKEWDYTPRNPFQESLQRPKNPPYREANETAPRERHRENGDAETATREGRRDNGAAKTATAKTTPRQRRRPKRHRQHSGSLTADTARKLESDFRAFFSIPYQTFQRNAPSVARCHSQPTCGYSVRGAIVGSLERWQPVSKSMYSNCQ